MTGVHSNADGDGMVTVYDAVHILKVTAGIVDADASKVKNADVNGDGSITVTEATAILRYIARLTDKLN